MSAVLIRTRAPVCSAHARWWRTPDFHIEAAILDACEQLAAWGDRADAQRARELRKAIVRDAVAAINRRDRGRRLVRSIGLIIATLAATALVVGTVL